MTSIACRAQMQFYVVFPFLLISLRPAQEGFHQRVALFLAAIGMAAIPQRAWIAW